MRAAAKRVGIRGVVFGLSFLFFVLAVSALFYSHRRSSAKIQSIKRLKQIHLALAAYHAENGCFPPAYVADETGRPMHSWRVLILPYLGEEDLFRQYDFSEPWDGPHNRALAAHVPFLYRSPFHELPDPTTTPYVALVGGSALPDSRSLEPSGIRYRILLVECVNSDIGWMEPRDIRCGQVRDGLRAYDGQCIPGEHGEEILVLLDYGEVTWVSVDAVRASLSNARDVDSSVIGVPLAPGFTVE